MFFRHRAICALLLPADVSRNLSLYVSYIRGVIQEQYLSKFNRRPRSQHNCTRSSAFQCDQLHRFTNFHLEAAIRNAPVIARVVGSDIGNRQSFARGVRDDVRTMKPLVDNAIAMFAGNSEFSRSLNLNHLIQGRFGFKIDCFLPLLRDTASEQKCEKKRELQ